MSHKKQMEQCCDDIVACKDTEDHQGFCDAFKEFLSCCEKEGQTKKHGAAQAPADLDACEQKLQAAVAPQTATAKTTGSAQKAGFVVPPAVWSFLIQAALAALQELRDRRQNPTP